MSEGNHWYRVSKQRPCPICGKPDWCLFAGPEEDPTAVICGRIESPKRCGEAGWLHRLKEDRDWRGDSWRVRRIRVPVSTISPTVDFASLAQQCQDEMTPPAVLELAGQLGLSEDSLRRLKVGWAGERQAWTFPMCNAVEEVVGIRLRFRNGRKLSVTGGHEGLFLPANLEARGRLAICEGPTDTAAMLDLGFPAIGRPSCNGGVQHIVGLVQRLEPHEVVIMADADEPGQLGADSLAASLAVYVPMVHLITPPAGVKDARAWKQAGASAADVEAMIAATPARALRIRALVK